MTEQELDELMRRVLLDAAEGETAEMDLDGLPPLSPSSRHEAQMRAMLADPVKWANKKTHPIWKTVLRRAAVFLLAVFISLGVVVCIPSARAAMRQWYIQWKTSMRFEYHYTEQELPDEMPLYEITALPEGFVEAEAERLETHVTMSLVYRNSTGEVIYFDYYFLHEGGFTIYTLGESDTLYNVEVNHMPGQYIESSIPNHFNSVTWIDEEANIQFEVAGVFDRDSIMHIAESISLVETTK